jgi:hypothetical protein
MAVAKGAAATVGSAVPRAASGVVVLKIPRLAAAAVAPAKRTPTIEDAVTRAVRCFIDTPYLQLSMWLQRYGEAGQEQPKLR